MMVRFSCITISFLASQVAELHRLGHCKEGERARFTGTLNLVWVAILQVALISIFLPNALIWHCGTSSFIMSLRAVSLGDWFCSSRKGWVGASARVQTVWPLVKENPWQAWMAHFFPGSLDFKFANWWVWFAEVTSGKSFKPNSLRKRLLKCFVWERVNPLVVTCTQSAVAAFRSGYSIQCWYYLGKYSLPYETE